MATDPPRYRRPGDAPAAVGVIDRPRYRRRREDRLVAGVASGLADHLGLDPLKVRIAFAVLAGFGGFGVLLYGGYWLFVPQAGAVDTEAPAGLRAASRLGLRSVPARVFDEQQPIQLVALLALALGAVLLGQRTGLGVPGFLLWPALAVGAGLAVLWRQADEADAARADAARAGAAGADAADGSRAGGADAAVAEGDPAGAGSTYGLTRARRVFGAARFAGGVTLVALGLASFLFFSSDAASAARGLSGGAIVVVGAALIAGPWLLRIWQSLSDERAERIRSQAHADLAAHLHDSVLQTLALIQRQAHDPRAVIRLARGQERDLRTFLYAEASLPDGAASVAAALREVAGEVEESAGVPVEVVTVGDGPVDEARGALVAAAREAILNAAKHAGTARIDVYAEVDATGVSVFVRDRGVGFDPAGVSDDRAGIRNSIVGRMARHGGRAEIRSAPGTGTEVELRLPA
jgi:signal transduction histidine kinase/phage shock protein PspC (stress-responsive transcriptional regulator)